MSSEKYSPKEKGIGGYIMGGFIILAAFPAYTFGIVALFLFGLGILMICGQYAQNRLVPVNNILFKYKKYIEQLHSEIPEKYHDALLSNLHNCHYSSFGGFDESIIFSTDELDQHINEFMKDADHNLKEYAKMQMKVPK